MDNSTALRRIAVFTGSRAEYGLLRHLVAAIHIEPSLHIQLIVSGSHLSDRYGRTAREIEDDGLQPAAIVPLSLDKSPQPSMAQLSAEALAGIALALERLKPDLLILLGDRYEAFAAASAAYLLRIPIVHLHGGETTAGAIDDRLRHSISQLSNWHFTAAEPYRDRVISMGHPPERVWNVGPMVLDGLVAAPPANRRDFEEHTGFRFGKCNVLITYHPETLLEDWGASGFEALLNALRRTNCHILFTHPNADHGNELLLQMLDRFVEDYPERSWVIPSLGQQLYLAALQLFEAMAGNSSSGIIEAPLLGMPVLNIGDRQAGRLRNAGVHDVGADPDSIASGLDYVLTAGQRSRWPRPLPQPDLAPSAVIMAWLRSQNQG